MTARQKVARGVKPTTSLSPGQSPSVEQFGQKKMARERDGADGEFKEKREREKEKERERD